MDRAGLAARLEAARDELNRKRSPRRRSRLPSPSAVRELAALGPDELRRLSSPARLARAGRLSDGERLVGLLMIRNETDILATMLDSAVAYFDRILVLDGSDPGYERQTTAEMLGRYPEVKLVAHDDDLPRSGPTRDGARQLLLDAARDRYGVDQWLGILHGDEIHLQDPRPALASLNPLLNPCVRVRTAHFFLSPDDDADDPRFGAEGPGLRRYMFPGIPETRFFFDSGRRNYEWDRHSKVVPRSLRTGPLLDGLVVAHLNFRSAAQARKRATDRIDSRWQSAHYLPVRDHDAVVTQSLNIAGYRDIDVDHRDPVHGRARPVTTTEAPIRPRTDLQPILIGGTGRCGSTLLKEVLGTNPRLCTFPFELKALSWPGGLADLVHAPNYRRALRLQARLLDFRSTHVPEFADPTTTNWGFRANAGGDGYPGYDDAVRLVCRVLGSRRTTTAQRATAAASFIGLLVAHLTGQHPTAKGWIEQTPANVENAERVAQVLPTATMVHAVRNPTAVIASLLSMAWGPTTVDEAIHHIRRTHDRWQAFVDNPGSTGQIAVVRLEDLLAEPVATLEAIVMPWATDADWVPAIPTPGRQPTSGQELSPTDRRIIGRQLGDVFERYGYPQPT